MIEQTTLFYVLAQIAGVFVGFGTLIAVSSPGKIDHLERQTVAACVMIGLFVIVGALFPIVLFSFGMPAPTVWCVSAVVILTFNWITIWPQRDAFTVPLKERRYGSFLLLAGIEFMVQLPLILILLPVLRGHAAALYATMLVVSIFQAASYLMWLVLGLTRKQS